MSLCLVPKSSEQWANHAALARYRLYLLAVLRAFHPPAKIITLSGDYDFQFMNEARAVGVQFKLPYPHMVVNTADLGLIRQSQRGFAMDYCVQLAFDNIDTPETETLSTAYGVDHVKVVAGLGCNAPSLQQSSPNLTLPLLGEGTESN